MYRRQKNNFKVLLQRKHVKDSLQKGNEMLQFSASKPLTIRTWHLQVCWILVCHNFQLYISAAVPTFSEPHQHLKHQSHQIVDQLSPFLHQQPQCLNWSAGLLPYLQECVLQDKWNASVAPAVCTTIVTVSIDTAKTHHHARRLQTYSYQMQTHVSMSQNCRTCMA